MRRTSKKALTVQLKIQLDAVLLSICYFMQHDRRVAHLAPPVRHGVPRSSPALARAGHFSVVVSNHIHRFQL
jgi:hypothetical protein